MPPHLGYTKYSDAHWDAKLASLAPDWEFHLHEGYHLMTILNRIMATKSSRFPIKSLDSPPPPMLHST